MSSDQMPSPAEISNAVYWLEQERNGAIAFIILAVTFVVLRFIGLRVASMKRKSMPFGPDDGLIIASLFAFIPLCVCQIIATNAYINSWDYTISMDQVVEDEITLHKYSYGLSICYPFATALPKLSILFMYRKIFNIHVAVRRITDVMIAFLVVNCIAWFVPTAAVCRPITDYWSVNPDRNCIDTTVFGTWISFPHIITDLVILILPLPVLWNTQLKLAKKIGLIITFIAGSTGLIGGVIRFAYYVHSTYVLRKGLDESTQSIATKGIMTTMECGMYLIAACLPSLRVLIRELHGSITSGLSSFRRRRSSADKGSGDSNSDGSPLNSVEKRGYAPKVNMKLTGLGNMQSWAVVSHAGDTLGAAAIRSV